METVKKEQNATPNTRVEEEANYDNIETGRNNDAVELALILAAKNSTLAAKTSSLTAKSSVN